MNSSLYGIIGILALIVLLAVFWWKRKEINRTNYRSLFWLGIIFLTIYALGALGGGDQTSSIFLILGVVYFVIGLMNKGQWGRQTKALNKVQERQMIVVLTLGVFLLTLGVIVYSLSVT